MDYVYVHDSVRTSRRARIEVSAYRPSDCRQPRFRAFVSQSRRLSACDSETRKASALDRRPPLLDVFSKEGSNRDQRRDINRFRNLNKIVLITPVVPRKAHLKVLAAHFHGTPLASNADTI